MTTAVGLVLEYVQESLFWAVFWFSMGCLLGWVIRGFWERMDDRGGSDEES